MLKFAQVVIEGLKILAGRDEKFSIRKSGDDFEWTAKTRPMTIILIFVTVMLHPDLAATIVGGLIGT